MAADKFSLGFFSNFFIYGSQSISALISCPAFCLPILLTCILFSSLSFMPIIWSSSSFGFN